MFWKKINLTKLRHVQIRTLVIFTLIYITVSRFFAFYNTNNYRHVSKDGIETELYKNVTSDLWKAKMKPQCSYFNILRSKRTYSTWGIPERLKFASFGIDNGSYVPLNCTPQFSVAVLVPFREMDRELEFFLPYMHNFLRNQNLHYKIFVIEQRDQMPFKKGLLQNIGARFAIDEGFPCLIFHDVGMVPVDESNLYVCLNDPRHLSTAIDKYRFLLPYKEWVGGALAIRTDQFVSINGYSNQIEFYNSVDNEFYDRLNTHEFKVKRIPPDMSRYIIRYYSKNTTPINSRWVVQNKKSRAKYHSDGLNNVEDKISHLEIEVHRLQTLIGVVLGPREGRTIKSKSPGIVLKYWKSLYCIALVIFVLLLW